MRRELGSLLGCLVWCGCSATAPMSAPPQGQVTGVVPISGSGGSGVAMVTMPVAGHAVAGSSAGTAGSAGQPGVTMPPSAAGAGGTTMPAEPGDDAGMPDASTAPITSMPGTIQVFDQIPQFGMYATEDPKGYQPPAGVTLWKRGTEFITKLTPQQKALIGADLSAHVTFHAQCDNYDRIGGVFAVRVAPGTTPKDSDPRLELVRFITPFSDYKRGALATYPFAAADLASQAHALADPAFDVWIGIGGGSNPYSGDPCDSDGKPDDFKAIGFKYSLELVSTKPLAPGMNLTLPGLYAVQAMKLPVTAMIDNPGAAISGHVTVIVSGHGADSGGDEYANTKDTLSVNGAMVGMFDTAIDCAQYAKFSPDGNQGIFGNNKSSNPRNWCPGALVPSHTFDASLNSGMNSISLAIDPSKLPMGSYYATSVSFSAP